MPALQRRGAGSPGGAAGTPCPMAMSPTASNEPHGQCTRSPQALGHRPQPGGAGEHPRSGQSWGAVMARGMARGSGGTRAASPHPESCQLPGTGGGEQPQGVLTPSRGRSGCDAASSAPAPCEPPVTHLQGEERHSGTRLNAPESQQPWCHHRSTHSPCFWAEEWDRPQHDVPSLLSPPKPTLESAQGATFLAAHMVIGKPQGEATPAGTDPGALLGADSPAVAGGTRWAPAGPEGLSAGAERAASLLHDCIFRAGLWQSSGTFQHPVGAGQMDFPWQNHPEHRLGSAPVGPAPAGPRLPGTPQPLASWAAAPLPSAAINLG